jgi:DNA-binding transcriptional MerR regulator
MTAEPRPGGDLVRLGEAARAAGVSAQQLQYYLMIGLIQPSAISAGNQRLFDRDTIRRIGVIRQLNSSGYSLRDIREIFISERQARQ